MFKFPFTNFHELNLDWVLSVVKKFSELVPPMETAVEDVQTALTDATEAVEKASEALTNANEAAETANEAKEIAEEAARGVIADGAVTTPKLANNAVTNAKILDGAITVTKIANNAVTNSKLVDNAVTANKIDNEAVTTAKIADNAVTSGKIDSGAVTEAKIADGAVTSGKIDSGAVTEAKIADYAVIEAKLSSSVRDKIAIDSGAGYIKYSDGTMIQYGKHTFTELNITKSWWGSLYETADAQHFGNWPIAFTEPPIITVTTASGQPVFLEGLQGTNGTDIGYSYFWSPAKKENITATFNYIAMGKWK